MTFKLDGSMIYLINASIFLRAKSFLAGRLIGYEIERWRAVDLDEPADFIVGEMVYKQRRAIGKKINKFNN